MDERFINLVEEVNSYSIDGIKNKIRTKILKEIEKLRRDDDEFSKDLERLEYDLWRHISEKYDDSNLKNLVKIYGSLNRLKFGIDYFTNTVNTNLKKIIFNKYYFYPLKYAFIKSLLSSSKYGLCITFRILLPRCRSNR